MDGFGENFCDFTHWSISASGKYVKKYSQDGKLICYVNWVDVGDDNG